MTKKLMLLLIVISGCIHSRVTQSDSNQQQKIISNNDSLYKIYKIDSINNYYLIYAKRQDTLYKIVSKKEIIPNCIHVRVGEEYMLLLSSIWTKKIMIGNVNASPSVIPHVTCLGFDDSTEICLERDSINDLHYAENIKGLCFIKQ